jgi:hypothetical protein
MPKKQLPPEVMDFLKKSGSKGGKKTVKKYGRKQMTEWGQLGGRPRRTKERKQRASMKGRNEK